MRSSILILLFAFIPISKVFGQGTNEGYDKESLVNVKLDVLNFISPVDPSFLGSVEYFLLPKWISVTHEVGWVMDIRSYENVEISKSIKVGHELRFYFPVIPEFEKTKAYLSGEYQFRRLVVNERYVLGYECDYRCVYYRNYEGDLNTVRKLWQVHMGVQANLSPRIFFELDFGIGQSEFDLRRNTIIQDAIFVETSRFIEQRDLRTEEAISVSGKLGFRLIGRKKRDKLF
ncbi:MAG: hypothetical protein JXR10_02670 [Cyclobacteriaceae bacterium]